MLPLLQGRKSTCAPQAFLLKDSFDCNSNYTHDFHTLCPKGLVPSPLSALDPA